MAEQEVDIISHLLDMERNASEVLNQAQSEAEKRISAAKSRADQQFKAQYEKIVADEESRFASETSAVSQNMMPIYLPTKKGLLRQIKIYLPLTRC